MRRVLEYIKENPRFSVAVITNAVALFVAIWWCFDSNWNEAGPIEIEPIVTSIGLFATLLGLNFVNDKLTKPHLKAHLQISMTTNPNGNGVIHAISVTVENHSIVKAFIKAFQVKLSGREECIQFLHEGFTGQLLPKVVLEPGQSYSFNITRHNLRFAPDNPEAYRDFVITTDVGHTFIVPAKIFQEHFRALMSAET